MRIDIYSDTICPWCYIGKRRLQRALSARPDLEAIVHWHAFQLNPWMPAAGMPREEYLRAKFGASDAGRIYASIREVGATEGIDFRFDLMERTPNTVRSHRLIAWAAEQSGDDPQGAVVEALFQLYFLEGKDLGATVTLLEAVERTGLDMDLAEAFLATDLYADRVVQEDAHARRMGIQGVPCFIVEGSYAISGAQEPEYFFPLFDLIETGQAAAE
ncbi:MAG: DsbA family oxidoreductase [Alphaproteobacteria bacterium]|nr:DsbA family oxidoreductase [Alphaproteobacteria bacterium]MCB9928227.1 DsbA family oxidoreductase [Alphaproteobacteria bacterium]